MSVPDLFKLEAWQLTLLISVLMLFAVWFGVIFRNKYLGDSHPKSTALTILETSVFGLLGLMLAFTYNSAGTRFEQHRRLIVEESNCISTAILRADLYPENERTGFRNDFRHYLERRIEYYDSGFDDEILERIKQKNDSASKNLWDRASRLSKQPEMLAATQQMIPALNSMFDNASMRDFDYEALIPGAAVYMVVLLAIACSFIIGYNSNRLHKEERSLLIFFVILTSFVIYLILDLNRPKRGLINADIAYEKIMELRDMFK